MCAIQSWGFIQMFSLLSLMNFIRDSILSSFELGSNLFSSFFRARCRSPLGRASFGIGYHSQRYILGCKDQIPATSSVCCLDLSICLTTSHVSISRNIHCTFKDFIISSSISYCFEFQSKFCPVSFCIIKFVILINLKSP